MKFSDKKRLTFNELLLFYYIVFMAIIIDWIYRCVLTEGWCLPTSYYLIKFIAYISTFGILCALVFISDKASKYFLDIYKENQVRFNQINLNNEQSNNIQVLLFEISFISTPVGCLVFMIILKLIRIFGFDSLRYPKLHFINIKYILPFTNICYIIPIGFFGTFVMLFGRHYKHPIDLLLDVFKHIIERPLF